MLLSDTESTKMYHPENEEFYCGIEEFFYN